MRQKGPGLLFVRSIMAAFVLVPMNFFTVLSSTSAFCSRPSSSDEHRSEDYASLGGLPAEGRPDPLIYECLCDL